MKIIFKTVMAAFLCLIGCATLGSIGVPRPPIELPFVFDKANPMVSTDLYIAKDREFFFCLKYMYDGKDFADQERVRKLVGGGGENIYTGKLTDPGIPIPLKITVSSIESSGEKILLEKEFLTMGEDGHGINYFKRRIGYIHLPQGLCHVKVRCLKAIPELANTKINFGIYLRERGKV